MVDATNSADAPGRLGAGLGTHLFDLDTQLGRDYAAVDWAATRLGVPETWPDGLRNSFSLMVRSRFAMWMAWGHDLTFFCNDAYRRDTLGSKYPWALGRPTAQVWREIWDDVSPLIERVVGGGESTWDEGLLLFLERHGYAEETYHTFSYSPLLDGDGTVAGLFCVVSEDTGRVVSERRITAMRDLAGGLAESHTEADVFVAAERQLAADPHDLPFVLGYLIDDDGDSAQLTWSSGIDPGHPAAPPHLDLRDGTSPWSAECPRDGVARRVGDLSSRVGELPTGAWATPPVEALTLPLHVPGDERMAGFLVVGTSPHRPLDDDYVGFVELVAGQIAAALGRARAFEAERQRAEQMAELDRAKTTFFTNVSHELRTPLTLLLGPAEDALEDLAHPLEPAQRSRVEVVQRNGERLLKLVNTLLDFSRLESGRVMAHFEPVDLGKFTAELASMFDSALDRADLELIIDCPSPAEPVWVDREMWAKVVLNLVSNATKATFVGGITVRLEEHADAVLLSVTDTGVGIAEHEQARLFERFHRVSGAALRSHEGSGIGLALVAELVALHAGTVTVHSKEGQGSTFTVSIPTGRAHLPPEQIATGPGSGATATTVGAGYLAESLRWISPPAAKPAAPTEADAHRHRILIADDNADMRDYISGLLAADYEVRTAADGAVALQMARDAPPDLVLTDVMMPVLDGFGLLAALRAEPTTMHVPLVMLSARSGEDAAVEGLEAGADDYLVKPFAQRELLARVRANLELDRVRRLAAELERSRALLAHAEELAQVGSFEYDIAADSLLGTPRFYRLLDVGDDQLGTGGFAAATALVHPDDRERVARAGAESLRTGVPLDTEFRIGEHDRTLWLSATVDRAEDGALTRMCGSVQDITERLAAQRAALAVTAAREVAAREHEIAEQLQTSLLPARTFDADHLDVAGYYQAGVEGTQIGGDWYDVIELDAGRTALVLGDVMGRGVQAAAVMGQLRATVRAYARIELAPDTLLHLLDDAVREISESMIVTCVYAIYDPSEQTISYANAGHLPPLLTIPGEGTTRLTAGGPPLGAGRAWGRPETVTMPTGSTFTMYTDGLVEQRGTDLDDGIQRAVELLDAAVGPVEDLPAQLTSELLVDGQDDDVAVLVVRVSDRSTADRFSSCMIDSRLSAVASARDFTAQNLREWGVGGELVEDAELIVSELVTNAIVHGSPPVELRVRLGGDRVLIETLDSAVTTPQLRRAKPTDDNGRGLLIVSMLAERWGTRPTQAGKSVWCQLRLR